MVAAQQAAYHQPSAQGGDIDDYWRNPTSSNTALTVATVNSVGDISNPGGNIANLNYDSQNGLLTTVGSAGPVSNSFYGTTDQGGNVWERNDAVISGGSIRGLLGGSYTSSEHNLRSSARGPTPRDGRERFGFRVPRAIRTRCDCGVVPGEARARL